VEEYARKVGRRVRLLTAPIDPRVGLVPGEFDYPIWLNNPFVAEIVDARGFGDAAVRRLNEEKDNCCQFNHVIENICINYGVLPRRIRPSLYLTAVEQASSLDALRGLRRPLIALHAGGKTSPPPSSPWHEKRWIDLIDRCKDVAGFVQICKHDFDHCNLGIFAPHTSLREMFATIWACDAFIGFDSGPMHVAAAFDRPSLIVWDPEQKLAAEEGWQHAFSPAVTLRWGYAENRNLMILGERTEEVLEQVERWIRELCLRLMGTPHSMARIESQPR
jgi:hypothetical protein